MRYQDDAKEPEVVEEQSQSWRNRIAASDLDDDGSFEELGDDELMNYFDDNAVKARKAEAEPVKPNTVVHKSEKSL